MVSCTCLQRLAIVGPNIQTSLKGTIWLRYWDGKRATILAEDLHQWIPILPWITGRRYMLHKFPKAQGVQDYVLYHTIMSHVVVAVKRWNKTGVCDGCRVCSEGEHQTRGIGYASM